MKLVNVFLCATILTTHLGCSTMMATSADTAANPTNCKIALAQPARVNFDANKQTDMDKSEARAKLANSPYRLAQLNKPSGMSGTIEEALRDCN